LPNRHGGGHLDTLEENRSHRGSAAARVWVPASVDRRRAGSLRQHRRQRAGQQRGCAARRNGHDHEQGNEPRADCRHQRDGQLHLHERAGWHVRRAGRNAGVQGVVEDERPRDGEHREPRGRGARDRELERDGDRAVRIAAAADRQGRHAYRDQVRGDHAVAAAAESQLPDADQLGARCDPRTARSIRPAAR
jgi:hypothetical protein